MGDETTSRRHPLTQEHHHTRFDGIRGCPRPRFAYAQILGYSFGKDGTVGLLSQNKGSSSRQSKKKLGNKVNEWAL